MKWSPQQNAALDTVSQWHKMCMAEIKAGSELSQPVMRVFGYAGTGKTTLAKHFAKQIDGDTVYAAFTGKAAMVMRKSGCKNAKTLHSLIYNINQDSNTGRVRFEWNKDGEASKAAVIVVDECSMVDHELGANLLRYNRPILVFGDPAQLPPVKSRKDDANGTGAGFFTNHQPDVMLTEIHRQAAESPIIRLATKVREGGLLSYGEYGTSLICGRGDISSEDVLAADQILVGKNDTRHLYNRRIRELKLRKGYMPEPEDRIVCLKNNRSTGIFNGGLFRVIEVDERDESMKSENRMKMEIQSLDFSTNNTIEVECRMECWTGGLKDVDWRDKKGSDEFDYGYAMTVHKSQGSQWDNVMLFDQSRAFRDDWRKHLYTALTRAADRITVVI